MTKWNTFVHVYIQHIKYAFDQIMYIFFNFRNDKTAHVIVSRSHIALLFARIGKFTRTYGQLWPEWHCKIKRYGTVKLTKQEAINNRKTTWRLSWFLKFTIHFIQSLIEVSWKAICQLIIRCLINIVLDYSQS